MSLRDKLDDTKLRSLKYGDSEPYIVIDVVDQSFNSKSNPLINDALNLLPDNFNLLGNNINLRNTRIGAATVDTVRIGKFLTDPKHGPQFIAKQVGLQLMNVRSNFGKGPLVDQLYSPLNTLGQVAVSGIGGHIKRTGLIPGQFTNFLGDLETYESVKTKETENQLVKFKNQLISLNSTEVDQNQILFKLKQNKTFSSILNFFGKGDEIYSYLGGPSALNGMGLTSIKRYQNSLQDIYKNNKINLRGFDPSTLDRSKLNSSNGFTNGTQIIYPLLHGASIKAIDVYPEFNNILDKEFENGQTPIHISQIGLDLNSTLFSSFKQAKSYYNNPDTPYIYGSNKSSLPLSSSIKYNNLKGDTVSIKGNWYNNSREVRLGSGDQDLINLTPLFTLKEGQTDSVLIDNKVYPIRDIIKFRIETILDDKKSTWMVFRAYLNKITDSVSADWSEVKYVNRSEKLFKYSGFGRNVSINFKVAALSKDEMKPMYQKLNYLMSGLAGKYTDGILEGTFSRMTIGNYFDRQHCIITSLTYDISEETPWEIAIDEPENGEKVLILPHIINVSLTFIPIGVTNKGHNELPERDDNNKSFIAQNANADVNYINGGLNDGNSKWKSFEPQDVTNFYDKIKVDRFNNTVNNNFSVVDDTIQVNSLNNQA